MRWLILALLFPASALAGEAILTWSEPTKNTDGTDLTDLAMYELFYGCSGPGVYTGSEIILAPATTHTLLALPDVGTCYFAITAINAAGASSALSAEASKWMGGASLPEDIDPLTVVCEPPPDPPPPPPPPPDTITESYAAINSGRGDVASISHDAVVGDLLVVFILRNIRNDPVAVAPGWTEFKQQNGPDTVRYSIQYKVLEATDPTIFQWDVNRSTDWSIVLRSFTGASVVVSSSENAGTSNNHIVNSIDVAGGIGIAYAFADESSGTYTSTGGSFLQAPNRLIGSVVTNGTADFLLNYSTNYMTEHLIVQ